jgi:lysophospholipase-3
VLVQTPKRNYTVNDYEQFFTDVGFPLGWKMFQTSGKLLDDLQPPGVAVSGLGR